MKSGPKDHLTQSHAMLIGRALVATIVAFSFLAMIVPLGSARQAGRV